jgi:hypothetical protein
MSKLFRSDLSLRSGAILFSLFAALGACATTDASRNASASAPTIKPSQAAWGYPIGGTLSKPATPDDVKASKPAPTTTCGYEPAAPRTSPEASC